MAEPKAHPHKHRFGGFGPVALTWAMIKLIPLVLLFLVTAPFQWIAVKLGWNAVANTLPLLFHRLAAFLLKVKIHVRGEKPGDAPLLIVANHVTWLDIVIFSAVMPLCFVSKDEVASWPVIGMLARLQRTVFIDRTRRQTAARSNEEMGEALKNSPALMLFAEGTTSDGGRVLPFRSALVGSAMMAGEDGNTIHANLQPVTIAYVRRGGLPITRADRPDIGWYGDMDLLPSLLGILLGSPIDVVVMFGKTVPSDRFEDRKQATAAMETEVRRSLSGILRADDPLDATLADKLVNPPSKPRQAA